MADHSDHIIIDPQILCGKPVVKDTRLSVELIVGLLAKGWTHEQLLANYPQLKQADILACLKYAAARLRDEKIFPLTA